MQEAPDLSKIVSLIMQNPELISQISSLMKSGEESGETPSVAEEKKEEKVVVESSASAPIQPPHSQNKRRRKELLSAMKPYLSEHRQSAIDSMSSILDIIDVMARKES